MKKEIVNASLFLIVDSVAAKNELRKRACYSERICHTMAKKGEVVMAEPFRGRVLRLGQLPEAHAGMRTVAAPGDDSRRR